MTSPSAIVLATLLQYARHPATHNGPRWVVMTVPEDFLVVAQEALAEDLSTSQGELNG